MYTRGVPPSDVTLEGLVKWLLIEFEALEQAFAEQEEELQKIKEIQNAL